MASKLASVYSGCSKGFGLSRPKIGLGDVRCRLKAGLKKTDLRGCRTHRVKACSFGDGHSAPCRSGEW